MFQDGREHRLYLHINVYGIKSAMRELNASQEEINRVQGMRGKYYSLLPDGEKEYARDKQLYEEEFGKLYGSNSFSMDESSSDNDEGSEITPVEGNDLNDDNSEVVSSDESSDVDAEINQTDGFESEIQETPDGFLGLDDNDDDDDNGENDDEEDDFEASFEPNDGSDDNDAQSQSSSSDGSTNSSPDIESITSYLLVLKSMRDGFVETINNCEKSMDDIRQEMQDMKDKLIKYEDDLKYLEICKDAYSSFLGSAQSNIDNYESVLAKLQINTED